MKTTDLEVVVNVVTGVRVGYENKARFTLARYSNDTVTHSAAASQGDWVLFNYERYEFSVGFSCFAKRLKI